MSRPARTARARAWLNQTDVVVLDVLGLALAIVDEVVAAHGGLLTVEDAAPGAQIVVRIPRA